MNMNITYKGIIFVLTILISILAFLQIKGCENKSFNSYSQEYVDSLNFENTGLVDEIFELHDEISVIDSSIENREIVVLKGKDKIKYLEKIVTITDTIVITYVDALNTQIKDLDTLVVEQGKKIDKQGLIIVKQDTFISNTNKVMAIIENDNESLQNENKKKDKKIKILKFERIIYPILGIIGTVLIFK